jgi:hypothetical protein
MNDAQLATALRTIASRWNYSPDAALKLLDCAMQQNNLMEGRNSGPLPVKIEECPFMSDRSEWPTWTQALIPTDSKFERHFFADGKQLAKLVTSRALVLLATEIHAE